MIILDTHALLWWTLDPAEMSPKAYKLCSEVGLNRGFISSISIWEIGVKIENKKLDIGMTIESYLEKIESLNILKIVPVDENIWIESLALKWEHRDPADRVIVATARLKKLQIITRDNKISAFYKETIW